METRTICPYCGVGCGLILESAGDRVIGLKADPTHPVSRGTLCPKGATAHEFIHHPDRLNAPLVGRGGARRPVTWDEALTEAAQGFARIAREHGPKAVGVLSSARATVEENYLAQKFARTVLGTDRVDNCYRICHSATVVGLGASFGSGAMTNPISDLGPNGARVFLVVGSNTPHSHPIIWREWMKRAIDQGSKLILVDPRAPDLSRLAALHLPVRPGSEVALFNAMAQHILATGLADHTFIDSRTEGFEAFAAKIAGYRPETVAETCGVSADAIRNAAETYALDRPASIVYGLGVTEHRNGVDCVRALANLALLTGNVGRPFTGVNALRGQNNVQGATDMCRPETLPGYQAWNDEAAVAKFERAWNTRLPRPAPDEILYCSRYWERILQGEIRALYVIGSDPALTEGNITRVEAALDALDLLVVQDVFPSRTTERAHIVLPAASYAEKDGTYVNTERRVQRIHQAIPPVGGSRSDGWIITELARKMGHAWPEWSAADVFEEIRTLVPIYAGITYDRLAATGGIHWPCPDVSHAGTPMLHAEEFTRGRARFAAVDQTPPAEEPDEDYPFVLTTGRGFLQYNAGTMTRRTRLGSGEPECIVQLAPDDAARLGIRAKERVRVTTRRGTVEARAEIRPLRSGVIWMPFHYAEAPVNRLTNDVVDPECGITELKACAARVERIV